MAISLVRSLNILSFLASCYKPVTSTEIAQKLNEMGDHVSSDLINKYLRSNLSDYVDVVQIASGRTPGTYKLRGNWISPLPQDAVSVLIAQEYLRYLLPHLGEDEQFTYQVDNSKQVITQNKYSRWVGKVAVIPISQQLMIPDYNESVLREAYDALLREKKLEITYWRRAAPDKEKSYTLNPHGLLARGGLLYLLATCEGYSDIRQFACHRIISANVIEKEALLNSDFDIKALVESQKVNFAKRSESELFEARFTDAAIAHLLETPLTPDQKIEEAPEPGWNRLTATIKITEVLRWWVLGFADQVEVISPLSFRNEIAQAVNNASKNYR